VTRVDETVSTDPLFSNCKSIWHGFTAAQIFFGTKSHTIFVYGIKSRAEFPNVYKDFIRAQGAPSALRRDNAQEEKGEQVIDINREYMIKDEFTEPYHPQQNPVETSAIRYLKSQVQVLLDTTGAPDSAWFLAVQYVADVHNICSDNNLPDKMTPLQYKTGVTPDIQCSCSLHSGNQSCIWIMTKFGHLQRKEQEDGLELHTSLEIHLPIGFWMTRPSKCWLGVL